MKKTLAWILSFFLLLSSFPIAASAASASVSLSASGSVTVGNQIRVTVKISGSEAIGSWLFSMNYDPAYLEYISGADSGGGGALRFSDSVDSGVSSISKTVTFRAKKIGSTSVSVNSPQVVGFDSLTNMSAGSASRNINVVAAPTLSGDNNLASLSVSAGELTPAFSSATTEYAVSVPYEVAKLDVSAAASHSAASVAVTPGELVVGENVITVTVTAQNGSTRSYTLKVTRQQSELAGVTVSLDGTDYSVAYDPAVLPVPEGYTASTALYGEKKILSFLSPQDTLCIVYLEREGEAAWYLYDEANGAFSPMVTLTGTAADFVILDPPAEVSVPAGFIPETLAVGERAVSVYASEDSALKNIYLVYAMAKDGTPGFYYYDATLASFTSYFEHSALAAVEPEASPVLQSTLEKAENRADFMEILALCLGLLSVLLFIFLILALIFRRRKAVKPDFKEAVTPGNERPAPPASAQREEAGETPAAHEAQQASDPEQDSDWELLYGIDSDEKKK